MQTRSKSILRAKIRTGENVPSQKGVVQNAKGIIDFFLSGGPQKLSKSKFVEAWDTEAVNVQKMVKDSCVYIVASSSTLILRMS